MIRDTIEGGGCVAPATPRASAMAQLVTEVAYNRAFRQWFFEDPAAAVQAVRACPTRALGPGLPGPEFRVPPIPLTDIECRAIVSFGARSVSELAVAVLGRLRRPPAEKAALAASAA